ncbi:uncharacterized protein N7496_005009 [Penicillium cataractarum]|uniref:Carrier domain-containing protein n=1 Tax=Penicillium cataractarum TaxID=2100454 RepID=A0A9W9SFT0_9EURO|nr:uncharacterized protein N7496_005009 [Penicillium cataractarum]KAJ5377600.1 hypothetical protein N7496_005009 [Penicillium cataractarum]
MELLVFTDQSQCSTQLLASAVGSFQNAKILDPFLKESLEAIAQEAGSLAPDERKLIGSLNSVDAFLSSHENGEERYCVLSSTLLLCMAQIASIIIHTSRNPDFLSSNQGHQRRVLGLCTGLLPSVLTGAATNLQELISLGPRIVCVALRLALDVHRRSQLIATEDGSWSKAVRGVSLEELQDALDIFEQTNVSSPHHKVYISARASNSFTVSGPPRILERLFATSPVLQRSNSLSLPIFGPFHAAHLAATSTDYILEPVACIRRDIRPNTTLISPSTGCAYDGGSLHHVLRQAVDDILQRAICLDAVVTNLAPFCHDIRDGLRIMGPTTGTHVLRQNLATVGISLARDQSIDIFASEDSNDSDDIAIIGMSGRFPGGRDLTEFWTTLQKGRRMHKPVPTDRFNVNQYSDLSGPGMYGCFVDDIGDFDCSFFSMSPREAKQTDPTQRLLLMVTYEALETAGYSANCNDRIGTFFGQTTDDWREANAGQAPDIYYVPGNIRAFGPGRLNYFFKWDGPSYSIDTACSSSLAAIELACNSLRLGDCDVAVTGGGNVLTGPRMFQGLQKGGFLSPTGPCQTLDDQADGYCRGEGVGVVILKRLDKAIADNDHVYGVIKAVSTNHSAEAISITHPHQQTQERLFQRVLRRAGISCGQVDYVELHGTGTQVGDKTELASIVRMFRDSSTTGQPLPIGSVKANVGHGEAAAGITSLIKALLMFRENYIPPHTGIANCINKDISQAMGTSIQVPLARVPFTSRSNGGRRRVLVNSFNATVRLDPVICAISPKPTLLTEYIMAFRAQNKKRIHIHDLSYTTTVRRLHHHFRAAYLAADVEGLMEQISNGPVSPCLSTNVHDKRQIAFSFIGQGSQSVRQVARRLLDDCPTFQKQLVRLDDLTRAFGFPSFLDYINDYDCHGSEHKPASPIVEQLCLVAFEIAMADMWMSWGVRPAILLGHSLGEYSALCIAGALSVSDTLFLVGKRAQLMEEICTEDAYSMLMVNLSIASAQKLCSLFPTCEISCTNGPNSTIISGRKAQIQAFQSKLDSDGIRAEQMSLRYAFHSAQMDPVLEPFASIVRNIPLAKPRIPILSPLLGRMLPEDTEIIPEYLVRHIREPVNFVGAMDSGVGQVAQNGSISWLECGPGSGCLSMIRSCKKIPSSHLLPSMKRGVDGWKCISEALVHLYRQGHDIIWPSIQCDGEPKAQLLELPNYAFQNQRHWIDHVKEDQQSSPTAALKIPFLSTCVQYLQPKTAKSEDILTRTFVSDAKDPQLLAAIEGHRVHGQGLCPSSVYVDMAITSMQYSFTDPPKRDVNSIIGVEDVEIFHPLIVSDAGPETKVVIETTPIAASKTVTVTVKSEQETGTSATHSTCHVHLLDTKKQLSQWKRFSGFVSTRIEQLKDLTQHPGICHMPGDLVYRMFADIVDYDTKYHSIRQIFMDCERNEACGTIQLPGPEEHGQFTCSPYCTDGIIHFAGFILNNSLSRPKDTAYISTGWESLRLIPSRLQAKTYKIYACMREEEKSRLWVGDIYLLDGDEIIATCFKLTFRQMNMAVLRSLVNTPDHQGISPPGQYEHGSKIVPLEAVSSPLSTNYLASVSAIIAEELAIDAYAMKEHTLMEEMGVDSILAASISSRVQDTIGIALPMSLFAGKSSLSHIFSYLRQHQGSQPTTSNGSSTLSTPSSTPSIRSNHGSQGKSLFNDFLTVLVSQTGILLADIQSHTRFEELGVDSLLSIAVLSMFQDVTGKALPASVFQNNPTIGSMRTLLSGSDVAWTRQEIVKSEPASASTALISPQTYSHFASLLQGDPDSALPPLFLIAPGSGYPGSYMNLPQLRSKVPIYTMESPFLQRIPPEGWTMEDAASLYIKEIRRVRPRGPYLLGGWSIGGMYAYEITRQLLLTEQDDVLCIVMIDSPCPTPIPDMPIPTVEAVELTGLYAPVKRKGLPDIDMPLHLKEHTVGSLNALRKYEPRPLESNRRPRLVVQIWASMGQYDQLPERLQEASELLAAQKAGTLSKDYVLGEGVGREWQTEPRQSFGPCGWDQLTGAVECHVVTGDHESIMSPPQISVTGSLLEDAIERALAMR